MKTKRKILCLATALLLTAVAGSSFKQAKEQATLITKAGWLIGTWEMKSPKGSIFETWIQKNDRELSGKSYKINGKDTLILEAVQLVQRAEGLFYIPTVKNQNQGAAVSFSSVATTSGEKLVFENLDHDFPQRISYSRITKDSLLAVISGTLNGQQRAQQFPMRKIR